MLTQAEFLERIWREIIRRGTDPKSIRNEVKSRATERGEFLAAIAKKGVSPGQLGSLLEQDRIETLFAVLYLIESEGVERDVWAGIHEILHSSDPERERMGRPGDGVLSLDDAYDVAFSPDSRRIVCAADGSIREIATGKVLARCRLPPHASGVSWSPNDDWIAIINTSGKIRLCRAQTGAKGAEVRMKKEGSVVEFSRDGSELFSGDWDGNVFVWSIPKGKLLFSARYPNCMINSARQTKEGWAIAASVKGGDGPTFVSVRDRKLEKELRRFETRRFFSFVSDELGAAKNYRTALELVELKTGKTKRTSSKAIAGLPHACSPDGRFLVLLDSPKFVFVDLRKLTAVGTKNLGHANRASFSPDGKLVALTTLEGGGVWRTGELFKPG